MIELTCLHVIYRSHFWNSGIVFSSLCTFRVVFGLCSQRKYPRDAEKLKLNSEMLKEASNVLRLTTYSGPSTSSCF
jgi:hypothetical protein